MCLLQEAEGLSAAGKGDRTVLGALLAHTAAPGAEAAAVTDAAIALFARAFSITC